MNKACKLKSHSLCIHFFCREPHIKNLLSLRKVISEVCKHQLYQSDPVVSSFEDFYHNIELDRFEKLHFTTNYTQFYQDKFETEEGAKAVVFANGDVINNVSDSKLMYVDASFKIETIENFNYQLVTVLVWVEDSVSIVLVLTLTNYAVCIGKSVL